MLLRKPLRDEFETYKKLELEFYLHHKPYKTLLQDVDPRKRDLKKEFIKILREKNSFFRFIEYDGQVAGYIYGMIKAVGENEKNWKKIGDLNSIVVLKKYRNRGLAKYLARKFFRWLKSRGIRYAEASCNVKNKAVIAFNKKLGFKEQHIKFGKVL